MRIRNLLNFVVATCLLILCTSIAYAFDLPEYKTSSLSTGAKVFTIQTPELPMIHFRITFDVGSNHEVVGSEGTIQILKDWMDDGTKDLDRQALAEKLNALGIQLSNESNFETITFTMNTLSKYQTEAVDLWLKYLFQPKLDDEHFNDIRARVADSVKMNLTDGDTLVRANFYNVMFGAGSYHTSEPSNPEAIAKITSSTVRSFYNDYFGLTNARLVVVGDFNNSLFDQINAYAKTINRINKVAPEMNSNLLPEPTPGIFLIDRPLNQGYIRIGHRAINRTDSNYYTYQLANEVLGGSSNSALYNRIRNKEGLAYSVFSATPAWDKSGVWYMSFATKLDKVPFGIKAAIDTVIELQKSGLTADNFKRAQNAYIKSMPFRLQTFENTASFIDYYEELGIGQKGFSYDEEKYRGVTQSEAESVLRKVINPEKFIIVIAGPKDKLLEPLSKIGKVTIL